MFLLCSVSLHEISPNKLTHTYGWSPFPFHIKQTETHTHTMLHHVFVPDMFSTVVCVCVAREYVFYSVLFRYTRNKRTQTYSQVVTTAISHQTNQKHKHTQCYIVSLYKACFRQSSAYVCSKERDLTVMVSFPQTNFLFKGQLWHYNRNRFGRQSRKKKRARDVISFHSNYQGKSWQLSNLFLPTIKKSY